MPPATKKRKIETMRCPKYPVSFEEFKKLIKNLPDLCLQIQSDKVAGKGVKSLDECAVWYYESFYRDPQIRRKYPYELSSCPKRIRDNLLSMPELEPVGEPVTEHQNADGVLVKVARMGKFFFPVTFFTFKSIVNVKKVLRMMGMTKEELKAVMADEEQCELVLRKFYNTFYMFPDRQSTDIFYSISPQLLEQALKHGEPCDELAKKSVEKHDTAKKRHPVVSFEEFEKFLENIYEIVWQLKMHNKQYESLDFDKCARALYLAFYVEPEIRDKYTFKWRPCSMAMQKRLLNIPDKESAQELQKSLFELFPSTPNEEEEENNNNNTFEKQHRMPPSGNEVEEEAREVDQADNQEKAYEKEYNSLLKQAEADEQLFVTIKGVIYEFPVSFNGFLQFINFDELMPQLVKRNRISKLSELQLLRRFYTLFYVDEKTRSRYKFSFPAALPALKEKLLSMAKPLSQPVMEDAVAKEWGPVMCSQELTEVVLESSDDFEEELFQTDVELDIGKTGRFIFPVSFDTFRRCINYAEIIRPVLMLEIQDESQLADLIPHPQNPICEKIFLRFYRSFYVFPDSRQRFQYRFSCADHRVLKKLTEYAKPLDENAINTLKQHKTTKTIPTEQKKNNPAEEAETVTVLAQEDPKEIENIENIEAKEIIDNIEKRPKEKAKKLSKLPVTFDVFKRYVRNLKEILDQMKLCDEYKEKSDTECAKEYYKGFYRSSEMRNKFEFKFKPCPAKIRAALLSYAESEDSSQKSGDECVEDVLPVATTGATTSEKSRVIPAKENKVKDIHENHVSFKLFKSYVSNLNEIVQQMLLCDEHRGKSEEQCARDYYNGFYTSQNIRDTYPYRLKPCPAKIRSKLISFPTKDQPMEDTSSEKQSRLCDPIDISSKKLKKNILITETDKVEVDSIRETEVSPAQNQISNNLQQIPATLDQNSSKTLLKVKTIRTFQNGASFEYPVSFKTFKRHINYDEIVKLLLLTDDKNDTEQSNRDKRLLYKLYSSFYVQKDFRQSYPYRFQKADKDLLKKLNEYAVPLNDMARQTLSDQEQGKSPQKDESRLVPCAPKDETLITISGIAYRFPVSFKTFQKYINYDELKVGLVNGPGMKKKSPEQLAEILGDEKSCLRLLRSYYHSFYIMKNIRNKLNYNFNAAPPVLSEKLLELAIPIDQATEPAQSQPKDGVFDPQFKQGVPNTPAQGPTTAPVTLNIFLIYMQLDDVVTRMKQEPKYSAMSVDECKFRYYQAFYTDASVRDKYPFKIKPCAAKMREILLTPPSVQLSDHNYHFDNRHPDEMDLTLEAELARPQNLRQYINRHVSSPQKQALLEQHILDSINANENTFDPPQGKTSETGIIEGAPPSRHSENSAGVRRTCREEDKAKESPAEIGIQLNHLDSSKTNESISNKAKDSPDIPEPSTFVTLETTGEEIIEERTTTKENETVQRKEETTGTREKELATGPREEETTREEVVAGEETTKIQEKTSASKEPISEKEKESKKTNKSPLVPKQVIEINSSEETEPQKSSELASVTEETTTKENHQQNATNKPPEDANRAETSSDSTKKPETSTDSPSQDQQEATTQDGTGTSDSEAESNLSPQQSERQIILDQAKEEFFAESSEEHNMAYLISTSQGLKRAIWRILYQLSLEEFKTYTSIHNGEILYRNDGDLQPYYQHVVDKGNWPLNLYVKLPLLRQLLYSKGVSLGRLNLGQLSPKMLHWRTVEEHSNFDQIVEMHFKDRTGKEIDDFPQFFEERERLYEACWRHDQWIYEVPEVLSDALHDESCIKDWSLPDLNGIVLKSLPIVQSEEGSSQTEIISIASSSDMVPDSQSCPPTQLSNTLNINIVDILSCSILHDESSVMDPPVPESNEIVLESIPITESGDTNSQTEITSTPDLIPDSQSCPPTQLNNISNFVDIASVDVQSQVPEMPHDPLATQLEALASVKQEPIKFLNNLRANCDTDNCQWESIASEEQIINLDSTQEEGSSLSCFAIQKPSDKISPYQTLDSLLTATMFEGEDDVSLHTESDNIEDMPKQPVVEEQPEEPAVRPEPCPVVPEVLPLPKPPESRKKKLPESNAVPSKRIRLINDKVPQLRHEFRPLALGACNRIETENLRQDETPTEPPHIIPDAVSNTITPSQEFALGNSLLESSQLAPLLDTIPPGVTVRKVNEKEQVNKNLAKVTVPQPSLRQRAIFRRLERFHFFAPLTAQQIIKHRIEGYMEGARYESAILRINGKVSQVRGSLLNVLFPHISPLLLSDLERVLGHLQEFVYSCRWRRIQRDYAEDLRKRVLFAFMEMAPEFGPFLLHFETATREWATCSKMGRWDQAEREAEPRPRYLEKVISAGILGKMREFNQRVIEINEK